jgi:hypothetical protein
MAYLLPLPRMIFLDALGQPVTGQLYTYEAGTSTPKPTYTNSSGNTENPNPLDLNGGDANNIWFLGSYKIDVKDEDGVSLPGYPVDNVSAYDPVDWSDLTASIADLNATDTSTLSKSANYTVGLTDRGKTILADSTAGSFTISLPSAASATNGFEITIKRINSAPVANLVTIDPNASETIDGRTTFILYDKNDVVTLLCDGSNWRIKSGLIRGNVQYLTEDYTVTIADIGKTFVLSATENLTITLLSAVTAGDGFELTFKKSSDGFNITIEPDGSETIDGDSNFELESPWSSVTMKTDGANWLSTAEFGTSSNFQTGDIKYTIRSPAQPGWIALDDGTIGDATSGATTRANADTKDLFIFLWDEISDTYCPVSSGRGASAETDFDAHKTIQLPLFLSRVVGTANPGANTPDVYSVYVVDTSTDILTLSRNIITENYYTGTKIRFTTTGALPSPLVVDTDYYVIWVSSTEIKVATSVVNALAGTAINITTTGTGTQTVHAYLDSKALGYFQGEQIHADTVAETAPHTHNVDGNIVAGPTGAGTNYLSNALVPTASTGGGTPHNNVQPTIYLYAYIKL